MMTRATSTGYCAYDGNGNLCQVVDGSDGSIDAHYEYDPYGREILASGTYATSNAWRFSTKYLDPLDGGDPADPDAALLYYGYRFMSPRLGRWMSRDPVGEEGGAEFPKDSWKINPANALDPRGDSLITYCLPPGRPPSAGEELRGNLPDGA